MPVSSRKFATLLAQRLNDVMPKPFRLDARGELLDLYVGDQWDMTSYALERVADETRALNERLNDAVLSLLDPIQDTISEYLHAPWPSVDGRGMAMPGVRTDPEAVHFWYGADEEAPVVDVAPIKIREILSSEGVE